MIAFIAPWKYAEISSRKQPVRYKQQTIIDVVYLYFELINSYKLQALQKMPFTHRR